MRKLRALFLAGAIAVVGFTGITIASPPAQAVCGGGGPGEACYCPSHVDLKVKRISTGINC